MSATQAERWRRVKALVDEALDLPEAERKAFFDRTCGGDAGLRREVEALVAREARLGDFLGRPFFSLRTEDGDPDMDCDLGPYRLVRRLGSGGMGTVYLAERTDGEVCQRVAVKLLKRGLDSEEVVRRFQMERQILADLSHPYVARLLDAGTAPDGRPFFALEYVEGERIDAWCDERRLDVRARVELVRRVCEAVHFAHRSLVVHRDLKPANILVTSEGVPKLLDFGIAKLLERDARFTVLTTRPGSSPLSVPYASPEQLTGAPITTAVDVYALGVVLYELLTGHRPHRGDTLSPEVAARRLLAEKPVKPSAAVERRGDSPRLARHLRGDLDNIVLKALATEPERRYSSAEQLSEDLRRYLGGLPVRARPDTFLYRAGKLLRRHPVGVAASVLIAVLILGFGIAMARERDRAEQERDRANWVTEFLVRLPEAVDPERVPGETLTLHEALDAGAERLEREFKDQPDVRATLLDAIGRSYYRLALYGEARRSLEEALRLRRLHHGEDHVLVAETMHNLAALEDEEGDTEKAEALMRRALAIQRRGFPKGHRDLARGLNNLAVLLVYQGELEEAETLARESLRMAEKLFGPDHMEVTGPLNTLATVLRRQGESREAEDMFRRCVRLRRALEGPVSLELSNVLNGLAGTLTDQGRLDEATPIYDEALRIRRKLYPYDHPKLVAILNNVGRHRLFLGEPSPAGALLEEAFAMERRLHPEWTQRTALLARSLAWARLDSGDLSGCEEPARRALGFLHQHGGSARHVAETKSVLGGCLAGQGRLEEAEPLLRGGYQELLGALGEDDLVTRAARERLRRLPDPPVEARP